MSMLQSNPIHHVAPAPSFRFFDDFTPPPPNLRLRFFPLRKSAKNCKRFVRFRTRNPAFRTFLRPQLFLPQSLCAPRRYRRSVPSSFVMAMPMSKQPSL